MILIDTLFKLAILTLAVYAIVFAPSIYIQQSLWAQERAAAFETCINNLSGEIAKATFNESYKQGFRECKNLSENF